MESERFLIDAENEITRLYLEKNIKIKTSRKNLTPYSKSKLGHGGRIPPIIKGNEIIYKNSATSKCYNNQGKQISGESKIKSSNKNTLKNIYQKLLDNDFPEEDIWEHIGFTWQIVKEKPKWIPFPLTDKYSSYDKNGNKLKTFYPEKKETHTDRFIVTFNNNLII